MATSHTNKATANAAPKAAAGGFENEPPEIHLGPGLLRASDAVNDLLKLPTNWDGCGAPPIDARIAYRSLSVLDRLMSVSTPGPSVVPTSRGAVQFEWHTRGIDLELEFLSETELRVSFEDRRTGAQWDAERVGVLDRDELDRLAGAVGLLSRD